MSRSGYDDSYDCGEWQRICWRGAVASAIRGARGQAFLREMLAAMDALPEHTLLSHDLIDDYGSVCAIGAVGLQRGINMLPLDPQEPNEIAKVFGVAPALVKEIVYENDEAAGYWSNEHPASRFWRMRRWIESQLKGIVEEHQ